MKSLLLANPHSATPENPSTSQTIVNETRRSVLNVFNADPAHFEVVFVANATAGVKLVSEAFEGHKQGFGYYYHRDCHTSLVGVRELATNSKCFETDIDAEEWMTQSDQSDDELERLKLFAYPLQSNMNGRRLPQTWSTLLRCSPKASNAYTLVDAAAYVPTTPLNLCNQSTAPDFVVLSFYKMFGFPDLGALIVRKSAAGVFDHRRYFGGGTTDMITCHDEPWVARKEGSLAERLEDGSGPIRSILALRCAIENHATLFGTFREVSQHTEWLATYLYNTLSAMKHANGTALCHMYKDPDATYGDPRTQGSTIAFNIRNTDGSFIGSSRVGKLALERKIYIRAGSLCNPAGMAFSLCLNGADMKEAYNNGYRCGKEPDIHNGIPLGMVRVSFGAMSTMTDVEAFVNFVRTCFIEGKTEVENDEGDEDKTSSPPTLVGKENSEDQYENSEKTTKREISKLRECSWLCLMPYLRR